MKTALLLPLLALLAGPITDDPPPPQLTVLQGRAQVEVPPAPGRRAAPALRRAGEPTLALELPTRLTAPALSRLELRWLGRASVTVEGVAELWTEAGPGLILQRFTRAEIEVRRERLHVELLGRCEFEAAGVVLGLVGLADGGLEVIHRGGAPLVVRELGGEGRRCLRAGQRLRLGRVDS